MFDDFDNNKESLDDYDYFHKNGSYADDYGSGGKSFDFHKAVYVILFIVILLLCSK